VYGDRQERGKSRRDGKGGEAGKIGGGGGNFFSGWLGGLSYKENWRALGEKDPVDGKGSRKKREDWKKEGEKSFT